MGYTGNLSLRSSLLAHPLPLVFAFLSAPRLGRVTTLFLPLSVDGRSDKAFTSFQNTYLIIILGTTENLIPTLYAI